MTEPPDLLVRPRKGDQNAAPFKIRPGSAVNSGFMEMRGVEIDRPPGHGWALVVDDEPLEHLPGSGWLWVPGFYSGLVNAVLERNGQSIAEYVLRVDPALGKLDGTSYEAMLEQMINIDPSWIVGVEPATTEMGAQAEAEDSWVQFRRLRMHAPDFLNATQRIVQSPIVTHRPTRHLLPARRVQRIDTQTIRAAAVNGALGPLVDNHTDDSYELDYTDPSYDVPSYERDSDSAANRCVAALLLSVLRVTRGLRHELGRRVADEPQSETRSALVSRWPRRRELLDRFDSDLRRLLNQEPFRSVTRPEITAGGLTAVAANPEYSRAYDAGWRATRRGVSGVNRDELIWLRPTWELYERWCYLRLADRLSSRFLNGVREKRNGSEAYLTGSTERGAVATLQFQPNFPSLGDADKFPRFRSVSQRRIPDLVLAVEEDESRRYTVLDAKYTAAKKDVLSAMGSAHIYQDSLRCGDQRPDRSILLVPAAGAAPWIEDEGFIQSERVGVRELSPNMSDRDVDALIEGILGKTI